MNEKKARNDSETIADIRLLVLDIDGTILDDANRIRNSVIQSIQSAQSLGVAVAIATGRSCQSSQQSYDSIGSTSPLICYEGALIRQPHDGFVHRHWPLEPRTVALVLTHTEQLSLSGSLSVHFYVEDLLYVSNLNVAAATYLEGSKIEPHVVGDLWQLLDRAITKLIVVSDDAQAIARLSSQLQNLHSRIQVKRFKSVTFLEVFHRNVNKRLAVSYLAEEILGLRPENVMAIGDDFTDIEMLKYAGIGIAMGNANPAVKAFADWTTTSVEQDGVARAVERWILRRREVTVVS